MAAVRLIGGRRRNSIQTKSDVDLLLGRSGVRQHQKNGKCKNRETDRMQTCLVQDETSVALVLKSWMPAERLVLALAGRKTTAKIRSGHRFTGCGKGLGVRIRTSLTGYGKTPILF